MRFLWDHDRISYGQREEFTFPDGEVRQLTPVRYDGVQVGYVGRAASRLDGWGYLAGGGQYLTVGFESRADAADHLLSYTNPYGHQLS